MWRASVLLFMNCVIIRRSSLALPHHTFPGVHNPFSDPELYPEYYGPEATAAPPWRRNYVPTFSVSHQPDGANEDNGVDYPATGGRLDLENNQDNTPRKEHSPTAPRGDDASSSDNGKTVVYPNHNVTVPRLYQIYWKLRQEGKTLKEHYENAPIVRDMYGTGQGHRGRRRKPTVEDLAAVVAAAERKFGSPQSNDRMNSYAPIDPRENFPPHNRGTRSPYRLSDDYIDRPSFPVQGFELDTMHQMNQDVDGYWYLREQEQRRLEEEQKIWHTFNRRHHHRNFWEPKYYSQASGIGARAGHAWAMEPSLSSSLVEDSPEQPEPARVSILAADGDAVRAMDDIVIDQEAIAATHLQQNQWPSACVGCSQPAPETARRRMTTTLIWAPFIIKGLPPQVNPSKTRSSSYEPRDYVQPSATQPKNPGRRQRATTQPAPLSTTTTQPSSTTFNPAIADYYEDDSADEQGTEKPLETAKPVQKSSKTFSGVQVNPEFDDYYVDEDDVHEGPGSPITVLPLSAAGGNDLSSQRVDGVGSKSATEKNGGQLDSDGIGLRSPIVNDRAQGIRSQQPNQAGGRQTSSAPVGSFSTDGIDDDDKQAGATRPSSAECRNCLRADLGRKTNVGTANFESEIKRIAAERKQDEEADRQQYGFLSIPLSAAGSSNDLSRLRVDGVGSQSATEQNGGRLDSDIGSRTRIVNDPAQSDRRQQPNPAGGRQTSSASVGSLLTGIDDDRQAGAARPSSAECRNCLRADLERKTNAGTTSFESEIKRIAAKRKQDEEEDRRQYGFQGNSYQPDRNPNQSGKPAQTTSSRSFTVTSGRPPPSSSDSRNSPIGPVVRISPVSALGDGSEKASNGRRAEDVWDLQPEFDRDQSIYGRLADADTEESVPDFEDELDTATELGMNQVPVSSYAPQQPFVEDRPRRPQDPAAVNIRRRRQTQGAPEYIDVRDVTPPSYLSADERKTWNEVMDLAKQYATRFSSIVVDPQDELDNRKSVFIDAVESSREDFVGKIGSAWNLNDQKVVESIDELGDALDV